MTNNNDETARSGAEVSLMCWILLIFNCIFSTYVLKYNPKIGEYHVWLCLVLGVLYAFVTVFIIVWGIKRLIRNKSGKRIIIGVIILAAFAGVMWTHTVWPYYKDVIGGSKKVITDSYLVASDKIYFLDNAGKEVYLPISEDISRELKNRESYEYNVKTNLIRYYRDITIVYYPESRVIISIVVDE